MTTRRIYLSLGSNLGDRAAHLRLALRELEDRIDIRRVSSLYTTDPVGVTDQPEFFNVAVEADTELEPVELLATVKQIERDVGRRPTFRWGPRVLDIDILLYDDRMLETEELTIPHREMMNRAFVLIPLAEIAPNVIHPVAQRTTADLAAAVEGSHTVRRVGPLAPDATSSDHPEAT